MRIILIIRISPLKMIGIITQQQKVDNSKTLH
jgi:hypothetical protein